MARESPGQTLQPTALVHEAWLRLIKDDDQAWEPTFYRAKRAGVANELDAFDHTPPSRRRRILSSVAGRLPFIVSPFGLRLKKTQTNAATGLKTRRVSLNWMRLRLHLTMPLPVSSQTRTLELNRPNPNLC
jgi:hypothetical protein